MKAIVGGTVRAITHGVLPGGSGYVAGGRIAGVEAGSAAPSDARVIDARSEVVLLRIFDAHTHVGIRGEGNGRAGLDFNETSERPA